MWIEGFVEFDVVLGVDDVMEDVNVREGLDFVRKDRSGEVMDHLREAECLDVRWDAEMSDVGWTAARLDLTSNERPRRTQPTESSASWKVPEPAVVQSGRQCA